jgi:HSP20 family molecular chaperone IbpA
MDIEHLRQHAIAPRRPTASAAKWEPPIDVLETDDEVVILSAMPGLDPDAIEVGLEDGVLAIRGERAMPAELRRALIHRLKLPQGCFERRVALPAGRYAAVARATVNNCLVIRLKKAS